MKHNGIELAMVSDDGNGNRLWENSETGLVANETYDSETGESFGLNDNIEGWGYDESRSLL